MRLASALVSATACACVAIACGGSSFSEASSDGGGSDASSGGDGSQGGGDSGSMADGGGSSDGAIGDSPTDGPRFNCQDGGGFPPFDKTCSGGGCAVFLHTVDCCGSKVAYSIQHATLTDMQNAENAWEAQCAQCKCAPRPTVGEDGCMSATSQFAALCNSNGACEIKCL
jgi:hypothetical protein